MSLDCADFLTLFLSTSPLGHLVCLMLMSSDAENNNRYRWNWSLYVYPNFWRISDCCCQMITDFCKYLISEHRNDIFSAILWMTKKMSGLKIKLTDLQISHFHAPECCFVWWHTEKNFQLVGTLSPTPLAAYCGPQTPTSFSSFFTFP